MAAAKSYILRIIHAKNAARSFQIDITSALLKRGGGAHAITMKKRGNLGYEIRVVTKMSGPVYLLKLKL
jgi:hypothetical protein